MIDSMIDKIDNSTCQRFLTRTKNGFLCVSILRKIFTSSECIEGSSAHFWSQWLKDSITSLITLKLVIIQRTSNEKKPSAIKLYVQQVILRHNLLMANLILYLVWILWDRSIFNWPWTWGYKKSNLRSIIDLVLFNMLITSKWQVTCYKVSLLATPIWARWWELKVG